ncbi:MAG: hypothetical protein JNM18_07265 [Planctomycetaceae bacterium]|nr:hypothetical protein [Planctomycetaceae bacterium]
MENLVQGYESQFQKLQTSASLAESKQAVQRAQAAGLTVQIKAHRERIQKLKAMDAAWQVKAPALLTGEAGRRIVASPPHWEIAQTVWERDRPTTEQLLQWEVQLEALATPIESRSQDPGSALALTPEHVQSLADLGSQITRSLAEFEQRQLLLDELVRETAGIDPGSQTLQAALDKRRVAEVKARTERIVAAQQAARAEAEKQQADSLAKLERDLVEAETRLKEAERKATIAGLREQTTKVEAVLQEVAEEREFERALPQIRVSLGSFLAPGFALRREKTKGPASFSLIETQGALAPTREGLVKLVYLASVNNDRPLVGLPSWVDNDVSGETGWQRTPKEPMERAQALLTKWGPMLVKKGMLSP